jgi:Fic family protein
VLYMLTALEETARQGITTIHEIRTLFFQMKHRIRSEFRFYSQDLLNNLFNHPYTKIEFLRSDLGVSRITAARYLDQLVDGGFLTKRKVGRTNYYINDALYRILTGASMTEGES